MSITSDLPVRSLVSRSGHKISLTNVAIPYGAAPEPIGRTPATTRQRPDALTPSAEEDPRSPRRPQERLRRRYAIGRPVHRQGHAAREKGVDVLCALALIREARQPDIDLVILASHDCDLDPGLDDAAALGTAKVETFCWVDPQQRHRARMKRQTPSSLWFTPLGPTDFANCRDLTPYK